MKLSSRSKLLLGTFLAVVALGIPVAAMAQSTPAYTLNTTVRPHGTATGGWVEELGVKPGDQVQFALDFKNAGTTNLDKVAIGDRLPVGLTYVTGSTEWASGHTNSQWTKITNENWMDGGLNIGGYLPNANAVVRFTAKVADEAALSCGENTLVNHSFAKPEGQQNIQDSATVKVTKACETPAPAPASCGTFNADKGEGRTAIVKDFTYVAKDGSTFKHVVIAWGDGKETMTEEANGKSHQYDKDGTYTIKVTPYVTVPGQDMPLVDDTNICEQTVTFSAAATPVAATTPTTPAVLPEAGAGSIAVLFTAVSAVAAAAHRFFTFRRFGQ